MTNPAIEAAERALRRFDPWKSEQWYQGVLTAVTPPIRAAALEEAARAFEPNEDGHDSHSSRWTAEEVVAAIRALKEQP